MNPIVNWFNGNFPATISLYLLLMATIVVITTILSRLCVVLKIKVNLSGGVVAGLLLGIITSLPELVTCLVSAIATKSGELGFGDIIGSNNFDIFVLAICLFVCIWLFIDKKSDKGNTITLICTGAGTVFVFLAIVASKLMPQLVWGGFNFFSISVLFSYVICIVFIIKNAKVPAANKNEGLTEVNQAKQSLLFKLNLGWVIGLIVLISAVLIASATFLTYATQSLVEFHWANIFMEGGKESFGGALFLGVATSLPEVVCCVNLCIHKEYNMVIDTIVGSTIFNLFIIVIADIALACIPGSDLIYSWNKADIIQIVVSMIMIVSMIAYLLCNSKNIKSKLSAKKSLAINAPLLSITVLTFIGYVVAGFVA